MFAHGWRPRHTVLSILFATWIVSFMDRMVMSVAIPYIAKDFHLTPLAIGVTLSAFYATYALAHIPGGLLADRIGIRKVATVAMLWWSLFTGLTGTTANIGQMLATRLLFGAGEGVFPACAFKAIAVWFPKRERASANALMLASNPLGAALSPLVVVTIMSIWGWRAVFYALFVPGLIIAALFWFVVRDNPTDNTRISAEELRDLQASVDEEGPQAKASFGEVLRQPGILSYFGILFTFDLAYWGFATWLPTYLVQARGFSLAQMGITASLPFFAGFVGSILGGRISDRYFKRFRQVPILAAQAISIVLLYLTVSSETTQALVIAQTLTGFFINFFITAFWALPMNTVPKRMMGVSSALINMAGQLAAFTAPIIIGYLVGINAGDFHNAFYFLIGATIISGLLIFTLPRNPST